MLIHIQTGGAKAAVLRRISGHYLHPFLDWFTARQVGNGCCYLHRSCSNYCSLESIPIQCWNTRVRARSMWTRPGQSVTIRPFEFERGMYDFIFPLRGKKERSINNMLHYRSLYWSRLSLARESGWKTIFFIEFHFSLKDISVNLMFYIKHCVYIVCTVLKYSLFMSLNFRNKKPKDTNHLQSCYDTQNFSLTIDQNFILYLFPSLTSTMGI